MATHKSAKKRTRRTARRETINRTRVGRIRTFIKKVEQAIEGGNKSAAQIALREAQPELNRAAAKGSVHPNTVARKLSRLSARVKAM